MKKKIGIGLIVLIVGVLAINSFQKKNTTPEPVQNEEVTAAVSTPEDKAALGEAYPGLTSDHNVITESSSAIISRLKSGTGIVFLGFKECPWCQKFLPILDRAADAEAVPIHYLDIRKESQENASGYREIITFLSPYLRKDDNGQPRISTPDVSIVKNGSIIWRLEMDATTEAERTPETYWTPERQQRVLGELRTQIQAMK